MYKYRCKQKQFKVLHLLKNYNNNCFTLNLKMLQHQQENCSKVYSPYIWCPFYQIQYVGLQNEYQNHQPEWPIILAACAAFFWAGYKYRRDKTKLRFSIHGASEESVCLLLIDVRMFVTFLGVRSVTTEWPRKVSNQVFFTAKCYTERGTAMASCLSVCPSVCL